MDPLKRRIEDIDCFYKNQVGSGLKYYAGARYMRGNGWLGRIFPKPAITILTPLLKHLGQLGVNVARDTLSGSSFKKSLKDRSKEQGKIMVRNATDYIESKYLAPQTGSGFKSVPKVVPFSSLPPSARKVAKRKKKTQKGSKSKKIKKKSKNKPAKVKKSRKKRSTRRKKDIFD